MPEAPRLEDLPLFESLTRQELAELEEYMEAESFKAGETLIEENGPEDFLYVITSGTVEVQKEVLRGRLQHLATMQAPTVVGEMGLLTEPRATATVTAKTAVETQALPRASLLEKLEGGSEAAHKVIYQIGRTLAERMAQTDESIAEIIAHLERAESNRDLDVFRDRLIQEWSF